MSRTTKDLLYNVHNYLLQQRSRSTYSGQQSSHCTYLEPQRTRGTYLGQQCSSCKYLGQQRSYLNNTTKESLYIPRTTKWRLKNTSVPHLGNEGGGVHVEATD